jgi:hypothetical protein
MPEEDPKFVLFLSEAEFRFMQLYAFNSLDCQFPGEQSARIQSNPPAPAYGWLGSNSISS